MGRRGEKIAESFLKKNGFEILEKNVVLKIGELDIVARKKDTLVFVEVKTMEEGSPWGRPLDKVGTWKLKKLQQLATLYLILNKYPEEQEWRLDAIGIEMDFKNRKAKLEHVKDVG